MKRLAPLLLLPLLVAAGPVIWGPSSTATNLQDNLKTKRTNYVETGGGTDTATIQPPASLSASYTLTLPGDDGDPGYLLSTDGSGVLSWAAAGGVSIGGTVSGGTEGSVLFVGPGPTLAQDNSHFFWDDTNNRLGLGTTTPATFLEIKQNAAVITPGTNFFQLTNTHGTADDQFGLKFVNSGFAASAQIDNHLGPGGGASELIFYVDSNERMAIDYAGNFIVGGMVTAPFYVQPNGNIASIFNVDYVWPGSQGGVDTFLKNDGSGNLSWATPTGFANPMDSAGDMIYGGTAGVATKLDNGAANTLLQANGAAAPTWVSALTGLTQVNVDNLRLDGNTLSITAANQNLTIQANGSGTVDFTSAVTASGAVSPVGPVTIGNASQTTIGTNGSVFIDGSADVIQLRAQGHSTQTNDIFVVENSAGTDLLRTNTSQTTSLQTLFVDGSADAIQFTAQGNATQTNDIFVVENSAGTDLLRTNTTQTTALQPIFIDGSSDSIQLTVQGNATQTSNLIVAEDSAGTDLFRVGPSTTTSLQPFLVDGQTNTVQATIQGNGTQTANIFVVEDSTTADIFAVSTTLVSESVPLNIQGSTNAVQFDVVANTSQTADIFTVRGFSLGESIKVNGDDEATGANVVIRGTATNDDAVAGMVGEFFQNTKNPGGSALTSGTITDISGSGIALTAGDWDLSMQVCYSGTPSTTTQLLSFPGTASGNSTTGFSDFCLAGTTTNPTSTADICLNLAGCRILLSGSTTYYGKVKWQGTGTGPTYYGRITARRMR